MEQKLGIVMMVMMVCVVVSQVVVVVVVVVHGGAWWFLRLHILKHNTQLRVNALSNELGSFVSC
jgi:hypothetical protein